MNALTERANTPHHPEHAEALRILCAAGERPGKIIRVFSAGDPFAVLVEDTPRETILFICKREGGKGKPRTAALGPHGEVIAWDGWGDFVSA